MTHVANVAWPTPGLCFRMIYSGFNGYPTRCPEAPRWRGTFINPKGERWPVEACDEHATDVEDRVRDRCGEPGSSPTGSHADA